MGLLSLPWPIMLTLALLGEVLSPASIDVVITSPPYPNEKDYTRTTRLESVLLSFVEDKAQLRHLKQGLIRSNTRGVYRNDDDDGWVVDHPEIQRIAAAIEARRIELGKTSGFERMYARVTRLYFGGMARHLADLRYILRPGARLAYVVGDQASYLRVMIRTGQTPGRSGGVAGLRGRRDRSLSHSYRDGDVNSSARKLLYSSGRVKANHGKRTMKPTNRYKAYHRTNLLRSLH